MKASFFCTNTYLSAEPFRYPGWPTPPGLYRPEIGLKSVEVALVPKTNVTVEDEAAARKILRLMDALEENDDVQDVYANFDIPEQVLEAVAS